MGYRRQLYEWFGHLPLEVDDLLLLEPFQLLTLPERAPSPRLQVRGYAASRYHDESGVRERYAKQIA